MIMEENAIFLEQCDGKAVNKQILLYGFSVSVYCVNTNKASHILNCFISNEKSIKYS